MNEAGIRLVVERARLWGEKDPRVFALLVYGSVATRRANRAALTLLTLCVPDDGPAGTTLRADQFGLCRIENEEGRAAGPAPKSGRPAENESPVAWDG